MKMKKIWVLLILWGVLTQYNFAHACSCAMPGSPAEEFVRAGAVFSGRVLKKEVLKGYPVYNVTFEVIKAYKGITNEMVTLRTAQDGGMCGYPFLENEEYLVYADVIEGIIQAGICSRTRKLSTADIDLGILGE
jgi:hypothetical protein